MSDRLPELPDMPCPHPTEQRGKGGRVVNQKPVRLELNNSGAWKLIARFDAANEEAADEIMNAAEKLGQALHGYAGGCTLRITVDGVYPAPLMRWSYEEGWRDARTGEPA